MAEEKTDDITTRAEEKQAAEPAAAEQQGAEAPSPKSETQAAEKPVPDQPPAEGAEAVAASEAPGDAEVPVARRKGRGSRTVPVGVAHIRATFNNTVVTITDVRGGVIAWSNAGRAGFKGSRKSTAFAATLVGQDAARQAVGRGMHEVEVRVQGAGSGRESAIRALQSSGLSINVIKDVTPIPHNGCRPRKRRRV